MTVHLNEKNRTRKKGLLQFANHNILDTATRSSRSFRHQKTRVLGYCMRNPTIAISWKTSLVLPLVGQFEYTPRCLIPNP